ncbi:MAG: HAD family hydrolase [Planctomycetota bacterium]
MTVTQETTSSDYRLVALDLDGTVLDPDGEVDPALPPVLDRLRRRSVDIIICTGRRWRTTVPAIRELRHAAPAVVCAGGAAIKDGVSHETLLINSLPRQQARRTAEIFHGADLVPLFLYDRPLSQPDLVIQSSVRDRAERLGYVRRTFDQVEFRDDDFLDSAGEPLVIYTIDDKSKILDAESRVRDRLGNRCFITTLHQPGFPPDQWVLQVHDGSATKWNALKWLMDRDGISAEEVIAIGDDVNDVPMLRGAGRSFAMHNAVPAARKAADAVTGSNADNGVVQALEQSFSITLRY